MVKQREIWKSIPGYEGCYEVSDWGRVRSLNRVITRKDGRTFRVRGRILQPKITRQRRLRVSLGAQNEFFVHQLVLLAFVGPCPPGKECCHNDGDPSNNCPSNLRYGTHAANISDRKLHGTENIGVRNGGAKLTEKEVIEIRNKYAKGGITQQQLAEDYKVSIGTISKIVRREKWKHLQGADCSKVLEKIRHKGNSRFTADQVRKIRGMYAEGWSLLELSGEFNASKSTLYHLVTYRTWKDVD